MAVFTIGSKTLSGSPTGGAVGGASNLTTVGAIPYVSSSGVLNQDATKLFWDSANGRLGVGTASPNTAIHILKSDAAQTELRIENANTGGFANRLGFYRDATVNAYIDYVRNTGTLNIVNAYTAGAIQLATGGATKAVVQGTTGNVTVGTTTTDDNYKLSVTSSGSTGTVRIFDQTATTGSTLAVIQAGAGQSGNLLSVLNNAGSTVYFGIHPGNAYITTNLDLGNGGRTAELRSTGFEVGSSGAYFFSSTAGSNGTPDLGLARNAAGVMEINNGTPGTLRDLKLRNITVMDTTAVTGSTLAVIQAGAGQSGNLLSVRNNAGTELTYLASGGNINTDVTANFGTDVSFRNGGATQPAKLIASAPNNWLRMGQSVVIAWDNNTNAAGGSLDTGLARNAAGVLEINNGTLGTLRDLKLRNITVMDTTAVTGSTLAVIQAGAGQSGNLTEWRNNSGTRISSVGSGGELYAPSLQVISGGSTGFYLDNTNMDMKSTSALRFSNDGNFANTKDTGLARAAAGVLEVNNGTAGTVRDLKVRNFTAYDSNAAGSTLAIIQAGSSQSGNLLSVRNNAGSDLVTVSSAGYVGIGNSAYAMPLGVGVSNDASFNGIAQFLASGLTATHSAFVQIGKDNATSNNSTSISFYYAGSASASNRMDLGFYGGSPILSVIAGGSIQQVGVTVTNLPAAAAGNAGSRAYVTDANATTIGSTVAGGGSNKVLVWSNGTNWKIYAS